MGNETLLDLLMKGGFTIFILALSSIFSLKVIIEKLIQFNGIKSKYNEELLTQIAEKLEAKSLKEAITVCKNYKITSLGFKVSSPLANVMKYILEHLHLS